MRAWFVLFTALIATGAGLFAYKVRVLGYPLTATDQPGNWRVEEVFVATGKQGRVEIDVPLPRNSPYHNLVTEEVRSERLRFSIDETPGGRRGHWAGRLEGGTTLTYLGSITALANERPLPASELASAYSKNVSGFLEASDVVQAEDSVIVDLSQELGLDRADKIRVIREVFAFVSREIGASPNSQSSDAASVARAGRGTSLGRARLFCALTRANRVPCRIVTGLLLAEGHQNALRYWNEVYAGEGWVPIDLVERLIEKLPPDRLMLSTSDGPLIQTTGTDTFTHRFYLQADLESYAEFVRHRIIRSEHVLDRYSLLLLPSQNQHSLRFLLLVPLGALAMVVVRNVIGVKTFGMFMPMLIALAMTTTGLFWGTAYLAIIVAAALITRIGIHRLYLLLSARIAFILTIVVLLMVVVMIAGDRFDLPTRGIDAFPFVIMTMIVERISVSLEEEGFRNTINRIVSTLFAVYLTYAVIQARQLQTFFLVFPEMILVILGVLVAVGRYTGYRLTEIWRFREMIAPRRTPTEQSPQDHP